MFAQLEGQTIVRRRADAQRQYPSSLLGYVRHRSEDGKSLSPTANTQPPSWDFSKAFLDQRRLHDFLDTLKEYKKKLKRGEVRLLEILRTPFYAGCLERGGALKELEHVQPIVPVDLYEAVQHRLDDLKMLVRAHFGSKL